MSFKKLADSMLIPFCYLLKITKKIKPLPDREIPKKILIIRLGGLGDAIVISTILEQVKEISPQIEITVLASEETNEIFRRIPEGIINRIIVWKPLESLNIFNYLKGTEFDYILDTEQFSRISAIMALMPKSKQVLGFGGCGNKGKEDLYDSIVLFDDKKHISEAFLDLFNQVPMTTALDGLFLSMKNLSNYIQNIKINDSSRFNVYKFYENNGIRQDFKLIGIFPGVGDEAKMRKLPLLTWKKIVEELENNFKDCHIIVFGNKYDNEDVLEITKDMRNPIQFFNQPFDDFLYLLSELDLIICSDGGAGHLAGIFGVPAIVMFGPNTPVRWKPLGENISYIYSKLDCSPCIQTHKGIVPNRCQLYSVPRCMSNITSEDILEKVKEQLDKLDHYEQTIIT